MKLAVENGRRILWIFLEHLPNGMQKISKLVDARFTVLALLIVSSILLVCFDRFFETLAMMRTKEE